MSRTKDTLSVLEEIINTPSFTKDELNEVAIAMLCQIAISLAVIADKLTEEKEVTE